MIERYVQESILGRSQSAGLTEIRVVNPRDYCYDRHHTVDDKTYGGFPGMVIKAEPVAQAIESLGMAEPRILITEPSGRILDQSLCEELSHESELITICGHYEGIDARLGLEFNAEPISIGEFTLTGGELPALILLDSIIRLIPGALGNDSSAELDHFSASSSLGSPPSYTRPETWRGHAVPEVLLSGNHAAIRNWAESFRSKLT